MGTTFTKTVAVFGLAICMLCIDASAQYFAVGGLLIRPPGERYGVIVKAPAGLIGNEEFELPDKGGKLLVSEGPGKSSAWLLGGNNLDGVGPGPTGNKLGSLTNHDVEMIAGGDVRLVLVDAEAAVAVASSTELRFLDDDASNYVGFQAPSTAASDVVWTLPAADGANGQVLATNGTGTLSWASAGGGGGNFVATNVSSNYTVLSTDDLVQADVNLGSITITLPLANSVPAGKKIIVKAVTETPPGVSPGAVSLAVTATDTTIDSVPVALFFGSVIYPGQNVRLYSDGTNWRSW